MMPYSRLPHPKQLSLDLFTKDQFSLENYITGKNTEAVSTLLSVRQHILNGLHDSKGCIGSVLTKNKDYFAQQLSVEVRTGANEEPYSISIKDSPLSHLIYLWGAPQCGKTHLIQSLYNAIGAPYAVEYFPEDTRKLESIYCAGIDENSVPIAQQNILDSSASEAYIYRILPESQVRLIVIDNCQTLSPVQQSAVFYLINHLFPDTFLVVAGDQSPSALLLSDGLRSRLSRGLVFRLQPLSDEDKTSLMQNWAKERGLTLSPDVLKHLLTRMPRDPAQLLEKLKTLDRLALERKCRITRHLLRKSELELGLIDSAEPDC